MSGQDTAALVGRLRAGIGGYSRTGIVGTTAGLIRDAADLIESQAAQIEKLRAAVEPFAKAADLYNDCEQHPNGCPDDAQAGELFGVFVGDFRRARQALGDTK